MPAIRACGTKSLKPRRGNREGADSVGSAIKVAHKLPIGDQRNRNEYDYQNQECQRVDLDRKRSRPAAALSGRTQRVDFTDSSRLERRDVFQLGMAGRRGSCTHSAGLCTLCPHVRTRTVREQNVRQVEPHAVKVRRSGQQHFSLFDHAGWQNNREKVGYP